MEQSPAGAAAFGCLAWAYCYPGFEKELGWKSTQATTQFLNGLQLANSILWKIK